MGLHTNRNSEFFFFLSIRKIEYQHGLLIDVNSYQRRFTSFPNIYRRGLNSKSDSNTPLSNISFLNYILIGYYSCLILVKLILSNFPINVGRLIGVGLTPYMCNTVVLMHFLVLINITICYPWLR